jgi:hypothetical protein
MVAVSGTRCRVLPRGCRSLWGRAVLERHWVASLARVATSWALEAERPVSGHELLMCMRGCAARRANGDAVLKKNQKADAAASAVAKINNR